jgi:DNA repair ATPase RecN
MRSRTSTWQGIAGFVAGIFTIAIPSCSPSLPIDQYVAALDRAMIRFQEQHNDTDRAYRTAQNATRDAALADFRFSHPDTQSFISRWRTAEDEIKSLRAKYDAVLESADMFFTYCEDKANSIHDSELRQKVSMRIREKKNTFVSAAKKCDDSLDGLENASQKAKDIVSSLEVLGALNKLSEKPAELDRLTVSADAARGAVDDLVREGQGLLQSEFSSMR